MNKFKQVIFSQTAMKIINTIFFAILIFHSSILGFIGAIIWVLYLIHSIQTIHSLGFKIAFMIYCLVALLLIFLNIVTFVAFLLG